MSKTKRPMAPVRATIKANAMIAAMKAAKASPKAKGAKR